MALSVVVGKGVKEELGMVLFIATAFEEDMIREQWRQGLGAAAVVPDLKDGGNDFPCRKEGTGENWNCLWQ